MTPEQIQLKKDIDEWEKLQLWIKQAKEREMFLRKSIAERTFNSIKLPTGAFPEGTNKTKAPELGYGFSMTSQWKREVLEELMIPTLQEAALTAEQQKALIKMNPELSVKTYRALPTDKRTIIDKMLLVKQGTITLEATKIQPA